MAYIQRHLQESVLQLSQEYPAILIAGPRGCGKKAMLKMLIELEDALPKDVMKRDARIKGLNAPSTGKREIISLDNLRERDMAKNDPELFFQLHKPPLMISEVQYAPELLPYIKEIIDKNKRPGDFWLTGSHLYDLMNTVYTELSGSVALLNLFSYSRGEIDKEDYPPFKMDKKYLSSVKRPIIEAEELFKKICKGSMPEKVDYAKYIDTIIRRDVRDLGGAIDPVKFMRFVTIVASHTAKMLNVKLIADEAEIDQVTAKNWLGILANTGVIFYLHPYNHESLKRAVKSPKIYFYDSGLICYLTKWTSEKAALTGAMAGALLENYVVSEIVKGYCHHGAMPYIYYYRDRDAAEINLIIEEEGILHPIQIRMTSKPNKRMISSFVLIDRDPLRVGSGGIICLAKEFYELDKDLFVIPVSFV